MVCYVPGTGTLAVLGFAVYLVWHRAIMHFLGMVGLAMEVTLLLSAEVAVAIFLIWTARMIRRRRAATGACTTCRFRCQEALAARPNFFVNRVDRRVSPPPPVRRPARTCHPAAPILPAMPRPALPFPAGRRAQARHAAVPPAVPAPGRRGAVAPCPAPAPGPGPQLAPHPAAQLAPHPAAQLAGHSAARLPAGAHPPGRGPARARYPGPPPAGCRRG